MSPQHLFSIRLAVCVVLGGILTGCGSKDPDAAIAAVNSNNLQRLTNLYFSFQMKHDWRGPQDEQEFKDFLNDYSPKKLLRIGIDPEDTEALFVNERDGEPFKVRYGVRGSAMGSREPVVFEATGVDGVRLVGFLHMEQREVEAAEYDELWAGRAPITAPTRDTGKSQ